MGLLSGILGNAGEITKDEIDKEVGQIILSDEIIEKGFKTIRDLIVFTDKRLLLVDKQGFTGKKVEYMSIPYSKINMFSLETAGRFDLDAEMKIWVSGVSAPIKKEFKKGSAILEINALISHYTL